MNGKLFLAGVLLALAPLSSNAAFITGQIGLSGAMLPYCAAAGPCDFSAGSATGLNFGLNAWGVDGPMQVTFATGDFSLDGLGFGDAGTISDFEYDAPGLDPSPVDPLWAISGTDYDWEFVLETVNIEFRDADNIDLTGTGFLRGLCATAACGGVDYEETNGLWSFSGDAAGTIFSWSSTNIASEPGILLMFGFGLFGLAMARRFR